MINELVTIENNNDIFKCLTEPFVLNNDNQMAILIQNTNTNIATITLLDDIHKILTNSKTDSNIPLPPKPPPPRKIKEDISLKICNLNVCNISKFKLFLLKWIINNSSLK